MFRMKKEKTFPLTCKIQRMFLLLKMMERIVTQFNSELYFNVSLGHSNFIFLVFKIKIGVIVV